jgi:uncharacterized UBP type Zn finger protein
MSQCSHRNLVNPDVVPSGKGCKECLETGQKWVKLRMCEVCGHVGCCDSSPGMHANAHYETSKHPIMKSFEPGENWEWCYIDQTYV